MKYFFIISVFWLVTTASVPALAVGPGIIYTQPSSGPSSGSQRLINIINNLTSWLLGLLIVLSSVFIIYAAYLYLTAGANPDNAKQASHIILYAAVAIAVGLLSKVFVFIVQELLK